MKIEQLRFKNLNSLVGEWSIDFSHPAYAAEGIFAITGPTGAGKSTILDAMSLALYGGTPRLPVINSGVAGNGIMSRHTGECFAEVTFTCANGRFRCHWSQRRAQGKPEGKLQQYKHEFSDASSGKLLSGTKEQTALALVHTHLGMDFTQFTRSLLLAQGNFAAFLQAKGEERASILEQITGTEIYGHISRLVHGRTVDEEAKCKELEIFLGGISLLDAETEATLTSQRDTLYKQDVALGKALQTYQQQATWLQGMGAIRRQLAELADKGKSLYEVQRVFAPYREQLARDRAALEVQPAYTALAALRTSQKEDELILQEHKAQQIALALRVENAQALYQKARELAEASKLYREKALPTIRAVRELDTLLREKTASIQAAAKTLSEHAASAQGIHKNLIAVQEGKQKASSQHAEVTAFLEKHIADAGLVETSATIRSTLRTTYQEIQAARAKEAELNTVIIEKKQAITALSSVLEQQKQSEKNYALALEAMRDNATAQSAVLGDATLEQWHARQLAVTTKKHTLEQCQKNREAYWQISEKKEKLVTLQAEHEKQLTTTQGEHAEAVRLQTQLLTQHEAIEKELIVMQRIASLEEERRHLVPGDACPLCGATEHPYMHGQLPVERATASVLSSLKESEKVQTKRCVAREVKMGALRETLEQGTRVLADLKKDACELDAQFTPLAEGIEGANVADSARFAELSSQVHHEEAQTRVAIESVSKLEAERKVLQQQEVQAKENLSLLEKEAIKASGLAESIKGRAKMVQAEQGAQTEKVRLLLTDADEMLAPYAESCSSDTALPNLNLFEPLVRRLEKRRDAWVEKHTGQQQLEKDLATLHTQEQFYAQQAERAAQQHKKTDAELAILRSEHAVIFQKRASLFGERDPDAEETRLEKALYDAEKAATGTLQEAVDAEKAQANLHTRLTALTETIQTRAPKLAAQEKYFTTMAAQGSFADEAAYLAALLPVAQRNEYAARAAQLDEEQTGLAASEKSMRQRLAGEQAQALTEQTLEQVTEALAESDKQRTGLLQHLGGIEQQLQANEQGRQQAREHGARLAAQRKEFARWKNLDALVGSSEGKKYRNFAQGLTVEVMIGHANRQLQKMTDRYLLVRDTEQPLELSVIDSYLAGEERSTRNLSGGESFIVSLALALGLSRMASRTIRIDSLFLDEGFGSLDEESLETALDALAGLHQEGKLIGIISHVPALKERIPLAIEVVPENGGRSALRGAGCSRGGAE